MLTPEKNYEELPALSVRRDQLRSSLRIVIIAWMLGVVWSSCTSGSHVAIFGRMIGMDDLAFGLMAAIPSLMVFGQIIAALIIERVGVRKMLMIRSGVIHRALWFLIAAVPLIFWNNLPSQWAVVFLLSTLAISSFLGSMSGTTFTTWMGDMVPRRLRGRFMANRQVFSRPILVVTTLILGVILDQASGGQEGGETAAGNPVLLWTICGIFAVSALFGIADILCFYRIRDMIPRHGGGPGVPSHTTLRDVMITPFKNKDFRHYVIYGSCVTFAASVPGWFLMLNALENLQFSKLGANFIFLVVAPIMGLLGSRGWGRMVDRWGCRSTLILATLLISISIIPWLLASHDMASPQWLVEAMNACAAWVMGLLGKSNYVWITSDVPLSAYLLGASSGIMGGIAWNGIQIAQSGVMLGFSDQPGGSRFVAASSVVISLAGAIGGVFGGVVAQMLESMHDNPILVGPFLWNNWHIVIALSLLARWVSLFFIFRMPITHTSDFGDMMRTMSSSMFAGLVGFVTYPLRAFRFDQEQDEDEIRHRPKKDDSPPQ